jgi:hypothetical protein
MNKDRLWPEHVVAGFFHVLWIALATIVCVDADPRKIVADLSTISGGAAVLLGSALLGASVFVGGLFNRLLADLSSLLGRPHTERELLTILQRDPEAVKTLEIWWASKCLFRSVMVANIPIIVFSLILDSKTNSGKAACAIALIGGVIEGLTMIAFFAQRMHHGRLREELLHPNTPDTQ